MKKTLRVQTLIQQRRRKRLARRITLPARLGQGGFIGAAILSLALMLAVLGGAWMYADFTRALPSLEAIPALLEPVHGALLQPTRIYDRTGTHLLYTLQTPSAERKYLHMDGEIPTELAQAVVAALDPTFYQHPGFLLRTDLFTAPEAIPQRLVRELLLWQEPAGIRRAIRERILAAQLVARFGRGQVLEWFLNSAGYGAHNYGAEAAAQAYFGKAAAELTLAESAVLAAAIQAPALNPLDAPEAARANAAAVLEAMQAQGWIGAAEMQAARGQPLAFRAAPPEPDNPARAFSALALESLYRTLGQERVERGGLVILTTLDYDLQMQVNCTIRVHLARLEGSTPSEDTECSAARLLPLQLPDAVQYDDALQASAIILDPNSGQILALAGETNLRTEWPTLARHAPGSALTPFVYLAAFTRGYSPASLVWDIPASLPPSVKTLPGLPAEGYRGPLRLRLAMANDALAPAASLMAQMGAASTWQPATALGLRALAEQEDARDARILYTGGGLRLVELAQAYGAFAAGGILAGQPATGGELRPATVLSVYTVDGGAIVENALPARQAVLSAQLAYLVNHILSDSPARSSSLGYPNPLEIGRPAAAKIGQTLEQKHTWAIGYTPHLVVGAWTGFSATAETEQPVDWRTAADLWYALMQYASENLPPDDWIEPPGITTVEVCDPSGLLPTAACPNPVTEIFLAENSPSGYDTLYRELQVNRESGLLATIFTPAELVEERVYMIVPPDAESWAAEEGLPVPPESYDAIQAPPMGEDVRLDSPAMFTYVRGEVRLAGSAAGADLKSYRIQVGQGLNPTQWLQIGEEGTLPVRNALLGVWDTTGLEGLYAIRLQVVRTNNRIETAIVQVTVDNTPPVVELTYPARAETLTRQAGQAVTFQATVSDALQLERVEFWVDGKLTGTLLTPPFAYPWQAIKGEHTLVVKAFDMAGNQAESEEILFTVK